MSQTTLNTQNTKFTINNRLTYSDIPGTKPEAHGLLMNARFIQGIFDDKADVSRFSRMGYAWDAEANTDRLITALPRMETLRLAGLYGGLTRGNARF